MDHDAKMRPKLVEKHLRAWWGAVRLSFQRLLIGASVLSLGFHLRSSWIIKGGKQERGSHLDGFSFGSILFSTLSSFPDFRRHRTTGPFLQQRRYSISSWLPGLLSFNQ
jgi:hypothetical protein